MKQFELYDQDNRLGLFTEKSLAEQLINTAQHEDKERFYIKEVEAWDTLPPIHTHNACIYFENIKVVHVAKINGICLHDNNKNISMDKPSKKPVLCVAAAGVNEQDAKLQVKNKLQEMMDNGTYEMWKKSIMLIEKAEKCAQEKAKEKNISFKDGLPCNYTDWADWYQIVEECYKEEGL